MSSDEGMWIFGYGSLIWKPPPHADKRVPGYVENYVRRFWQVSVYFNVFNARYNVEDLIMFAVGKISEDHRGTPESPGRVVTLISRAHWESLTDKHPDASPRTWGAAYHIPDEHVQEVKEYLDIREINGYTINLATFHIPAPISEPISVTLESGGNRGAASHIQCLVYIGLPDNPQFLGPQDPDALAAHIVRSKGPSGENKEYVYRLEDALEGLRRETGMEDEIDYHVADLARRVRRAELALEQSA